MLLLRFLLNVFSSFFCFIKMLTGAINPTSGDATVKGRSIVSEIDSVRALLGYCPQFDALDSLLTPREHLLLYGRIKNIPSDILNQVYYFLSSRPILDSFCLNIFNLLFLNESL